MTRNIVNRGGTNSINLCSLVKGINPSPNQETLKNKFQMSYINISKFGRKRFGTTKVKFMKCFVFIEFAQFFFGSNHVIKC